MRLILDCRIIALFILRTHYTFISTKYFPKWKISIITKYDCFLKSYKSPFCLRLNSANIVLVVVMGKLWNVPEKGALFWLGTNSYRKLDGPVSLWRVVQVAFLCPDQKRRKKIVRKLRCSSCRLNYGVTCLQLAWVCLSLHTLYFVTFLSVPSCLPWFSGCWPLPATIARLCLCSPLWCRPLNRDLSLILHILYLLSLSIY